MAYLIMFLVVLGVNLLPAFGPPTWSILVLYRLQTHLNVVALVVIGALAAATGRFTLGMLFHRFRGRLSERRRKSLDAARDALQAKRRNSIAGLGLFALSPLPSAQLFEAAGLTGVALAPLVGVFFLGRIVSYAIYIGGASAVKSSSIGDTFRSSLTSPWAIGLQIAMVIAVVLLTRIDWTKHLPHASRGHGGGGQ